MQSARHSSIGLPRSRTSAERMLAFVTPPDVSKSFKGASRCARKVDAPEDSGSCGYSSGAGGLAGWGARHGSGQRRRNTAATAAGRRRAAGGLGLLDVVLPPAEAAEHLGLSRPFITRLLDAGDIPSMTLPGSRHRVVRLADVLVFQQRRERRRKGRRKVADVSDDLGTAM
ncbi:helix-turn-helix domain-containing protein [Streptomyces pseudogriseolus]|uniref:helix-turn-helix domain-containing protein n=1 Tax=Streptomyces pseudogriseolus TaxID=36817 RepID=UPI003FA2DFB8